MNAPRGAAQLVRGSPEQFEESQTSASPASISSNFSWLLFGNVAYVGCQWVMLVVLAKLRSPAALGQFALALAVTTPIVVFFNLALRQLQATDVRGDHGFEDYFALRLLTTPVCLAVISALAILVWRGEAVLVVFLVGVSKAAESISEIFFGFVQRTERMARIGISLTIKGGLSVAALATGLVFSDGLAVACALLAASSVGVLVLYDMRAPALPPRPWRPFRSIAHHARLVRLAIPLGIASSLLAFYANIPKYMIAYLRDDGDLGLFSALVYLSVGAGIVVESLAQSATPRLATHFTAEHPDDARRLFHRLLAISAGFGALTTVGVVLFGSAILTYCYGPEYTTEIGVLIVLAAGTIAVFPTSPANYALVAARMLGTQCALTAFASVLLAVTSAVLIGRYGNLGAALAVGASSLVALIMKVAAVEAWLAARSSGDRNFPS